MAKLLAHEIFRRAEAMAKVEVKTGLPYDMSEQFANNGRGIYYSGARHYEIT